MHIGAGGMKRQRLNVIRMEMLGAKAVPALSDQRTLKEAADEALVTWIANPNTFYVPGLAVSPHPYPMIVCHFQAIIGCEACGQILAKRGKLPVAAFTCVGGSSDVIGLFAGPVNGADTRLIGVEPAECGLTHDDHAVSLCKGEPSVMHGFHSHMIRDENGEPGAVYSISVGLDHPSVGPEYSYLENIGRAEYVSVTDKGAVDASFLLSRTEGIIPALGSSHALA